MLAERYTLGREISRGAVSRVYLARDHATGGDVVVKLFEPAPGIDAEQLSARFEREARLLSGLDHPNFVRTLEVVRDGDRKAIVSELVSGPSVADLIRAEAFAPEEVVRIAADLADALAYVASRGLARIDLKPGNVIIENGRPVIIDLGLAKQVGSGDGATDISVVGELIGTPRYLAPEQVTGVGPLDIRTDLYALGLIMFEMLAGRPARPDGDLNDALRSALTEDPAVDGLPGSDDLHSVLRGLLARDPEARPDDPADVRDSLQRTPEYRAATGAA
jgi:eukaryotic-like serine/threonine-protein kinase